MGCTSSKRTTLPPSAMRKPSSLPESAMKKAHTVDLNGEKDSSRLKRYPSNTQNSNGNKSITFDDSTNPATNTTLLSKKSEASHSNRSITGLEENRSKPKSIRFEELETSLKQKKSQITMAAAAAAAASANGAVPSPTSPHHERQKSVTGEKFNLDEDMASRLQRKQSNLHESLVPMNTTTTPIRDYYDGVDESDSVIGSGNWGVVKVIYRKRDQRKFACKIVKLDDEMTDEQFAELRSEIDALRQLDHVAIAKLYETFEEPGEYLYLVMELLTGGELYNALVERSPTGRFDEIRTRRLAKRMISAIAYLHDKGLVHRDVKLENFCFRGDEVEDEIVLIDFGLAKLYEMRNQETAIVGSSYYIAPEIIEGSYSGPTPDMWSIGVILFMMLAGRPPFDGSSDFNIMRRTAKGKYHMDDEVWKTEVSSYAQDFVKRCLTLKPADRITGKEALKHPFLTLSDEALIDAGAGDDPARALAPAVIPSVVSQQLDVFKRHTRRASQSLFGGAGSSNQEFLDRLQAFAGRHELVRIFAQAVAYCLAREDVRELTKCFVVLDRDQDGLITVADIEVGLMGATEEEVAEEIRIVSRNSITDNPKLQGKKPVTQKFFHTIDEATRFRRKRRREANYLFAAMDVQKKSKVSLNEFIAATLDFKFFKDDVLLTDAFCRLCGANAGRGVENLAVTIQLLEGVLGGRFNEKRAKRLVGEFVAIARYNDLAEPDQSPPSAPNAPAAAVVPTTVNSGSFRNASDRLRKLGSYTLGGAATAEDLPSSLAQRRVDVDRIVYSDFRLAMKHENE
ncbi:hypothetical protein BASA81_007401 [Batrachochytrium salamandrivorans]|nr:hypothetical protein BASA81_007401 [Batrachochytrium salamandrivorans]